MPRLTLTHAQTHAFDLSERCGGLLRAEADREDTQAKYHARAAEALLEEAEGLRMKTLDTIAQDHGLPPWPLTARLYREHHRLVVEWPEASESKRNLNKQPEGTP